MAQLAKYVGTDSTGCSPGCLISIFLKDPEHFSIIWIRIRIEIFGWILIRIHINAMWIQTIGPVPVLTSTRSCMCMKSFSGESTY
jgi:hypothetical protein